MFVAISDWIFDKNGIVYGCALNDEFRAIHIRVESNKDREPLLGSKYVQSDLGDIFSQVRIDLRAGKYVLFSGTSCQVDGLYGFLGDEVYSKLFTVDIVCHGVPSPLIWEHYIHFIERKYRAPIKKVTFRNKKTFGWADHVESFWLQTGKQINTSSYAALFYGHYILRPSCHKCPYKSRKRVSDISLADFWGANKSFPKFNDNIGVSAVIVNSEKGERLFRDVASNLIYMETNWESCMQTSFIKPFQESSRRNAFWNTLYEAGIDGVLQVFCNYRLDYVLHNLVPKSIYRKIKKYTLRDKM